MRIDVELGLDCLCQRSCSSKRGRRVLETLWRVSEPRQPVVLVSSSGAEQQPGQKNEKDIGMYETLLREAP